MTTDRANRFKKAKINIGSIELDCYQSPSGSYYFSLGGMKTQLKVYSGDTTGKKHLQPLLDANPESFKKDTQIEGKRAANLVELPLFKQVVKIYAKLGNDKCWALLDALIDESLERRADFAFGIVKTEQDRNDWIVSQCTNILPKPWEKRFSDEYYAGLSRLTGLEQEGCKRPMLWAKLTNEFVYSQLPIGVREKLVELRDNCDSPAKLHQHLSEFEGLTLFNDRMTTVLVLLRSCESISDFRQKLMSHKYQCYQQTLF
jgi:hypothetical protein